MVCDNACHNASHLTEHPADERHDQLLQPRHVLQVDGQLEGDRAQPPKGKVDRPPSTRKQQGQHTHDDGQHQQKRHRQL